MHTPFAGRPAGDAEPALPPPAQATATSALADPPLGQGALSSIPRGYVDESKVCTYCGVSYYRFTRLPEPTVSLTGSHGQMCASARRT